MLLDSGEGRDSREGREDVGADDLAGKKDRSDWGRRISLSVREGGFGGGWVDGLVRDEGSEGERKDIGEQGEKEGDDDDGCREEREGIGGGEEGGRSV
jgi:hypothetical protein